MTYAKDIALQRAEQDRKPYINFLEPNNFEVVIDRLTFPEIEYHIVEASIPGFDIGAAEIQMATRLSPQHADKVSYDRLSMTFLVDDKLVNYLEMHDWMLAQVIQLDNYSDDLKRRDIKLIINSPHNNQQRVVTFVDAFPIGLSQIDFSSRITSVEYITCTATFAYSYFKIS